MSSGKEAEAVAVEKKAEKLQPKADESTRQTDAARTTVE